MVSTEEYLGRTEGQGTYEGTALRRPQEANEAGGRRPGCSGMSGKIQAGPAHPHQLPASSQLLPSFAKTDS